MSKNSTRNTQLNDKKSDGCTFFPDASWKHCCVEHDGYYRKGGTASDRLEADKKLRKCVSESGHPFIAMIMYIGVRLFGGPLFPSKRRWGCSRKWSKSFRYDK